MAEEQQETKENTQKKETSLKEDLDLREYRVDSIVNVVPLEPCIVWAAISQKENEEAAYKSIGIPGFYDPQTKKFITLDGGRVVIEDFNDKLEDYVKKLDQNASTQTPQPPEGLGG